MQQRPRADSADPRLHSDSHRRGCAHRPARNVSSRVVDKRGRRRCFRHRIDCWCCSRGDRGQEVRCRFYSGGRSRCVADLHDRGGPDFGPGGHAWRGWTAGSWGGRFFPRHTDFRSAADRHRRPGIRGRRAVNCAPLFLPLPAQRGRDFDLPTSRLLNKRCARPTGCFPRLRLGPAPAPSGSEACRESVVESILALMGDRHSEKYPPLD
jgi:hypothetical protein